MFAPITIGIDPIMLEHTRTMIPESNGILYITETVSAIPQPNNIKPKDNKYIFTFLIFVAFVLRLCNIRTHWFHFHHSVHNHHIF